MSDDLDKRIAKFNEELPQLVAPGANERFIAALIARDRRRGEEIDRLRKMLDCRAGKLLKKGKSFVVVACDESYYLSVYRMIRRAEKLKERWTAEDETAYHAAVEAEGDWNEAHYTRGSSYERP